jgi:hypothetical protein
VCVCVCVLSRDDVSWNCSGEEKFSFQVSLHALCLLRGLIVTQLERCTRSIGKGRNLSDLKRVLWSGTGTVHKKKPWEWDLRERTISFWRS